MCDCLSDDGSIKIARYQHSIKEILNHSTGKAKSAKCRARFISYNPTQGVWKFKVTCSEQTSKSGGWDVQIWLEEDPDKAPGDLAFKANCRCPAWTYWGADYHAHGKDYLYGRPLSNGKAPRERDPEGKNLICKHVRVCLSEMMKGRKFF